MKNWSLVGVAMLAGVAATPAWSNILTFDGNICGPAGGQVCGNGSEIPQTYGDVAGVVDVQYDGVLGNAQTEPLNFWFANYSDLVNVAWRGNGDASGRAEIFLKPLDGNGITLLGLDLGSWPNSSRNTQLSILTGAGDILFETPVFEVNGLVHSSFDFNLTSADGIRIQWGPSAYNVGIDNVSFTTGSRPVPEPTTYALMAVGLVAVGAMVRRRRALA